MAVGHITGRPPRPSSSTSPQQASNNDEQQRTSAEREEEEEAQEQQTAAQKRGGGTRPPQLCPSVVAIVVPPPTTAATTPLTTITTTTMMMQQLDSLHCSGNGSQQQQLRQRGQLKPATAATSAAAHFPAAATRAIMVPMAPSSSAPSPSVLPPTNYCCCLDVNSADPGSECCSSAVATMTTTETLATVVRVPSTGDSSGQQRQQQQEPVHIQSRLRYRQQQQQPSDRMVTTTNRLATVVRVRSTGGASGRQREIVEGGQQRQQQREVVEGGRQRHQQDVQIQNGRRQMQQKFRQHQIHSQPTSQDDNGEGEVEGVETGDCECDSIGLAQQGRHSHQQRQHRCGQQNGQQENQQQGQRVQAVEDSVAELARRRRYRIALNFFNKKPDRGVQLLIDWGFVEPSARALARLLLERRGFSKQMIGEFVGTLNSPFHSQTLEYFINAVQMADMEIDVALRHLLTHFRLPGEAQKIDHIIQVFARQFKAANSQHPGQQQRLAASGLLSSPDTVYILSFAIIMLNTDLHTPALKNFKRMKLVEFVRNVTGTDEGRNLDPQMLAGIYQRVRDSEFRTGNDHVTQVSRVDQSIAPSKDKPKLVEPHRRLICYCRLNEVSDPNKRQSANSRQRDLFLFNDLLVVCKALNKRRPSSASSSPISSAVVPMAAATSAASSSSAVGSTSAAATASASASSPSAVTTIAWATPQHQNKNSNGGSCPLPAAVPVPQQSAPVPVLYTLRQWTSLIGVRTELFQTGHNPNGLLIRCPDGQQLVLNAKNADDRYRFVADVNESVAECTEMDRYRLQLELEKQQQQNKQQAQIERFIDPPLNFCPSPSLASKTDTRTANFTGLNVLTNGQLSGPPLSSSAPSTVIVVRDILTNSGQAENALATESRQALPSGQQNIQRVGLASSSLAMRTTPTTTRHRRWIQKTDVRPCNVNNERRSDQCCSNDGQHTHNCCPCLANSAQPSNQCLAGLDDSGHQPHQCCPSRLPLNTGPAAVNNTNTGGDGDGSASSSDSGVIVVLLTSDSVGGGDIAGANNDNK